MRKFTRKHKTIPRIDHAKFRKIIHMVPLKRRGTKCTRQEI